MDSIDKTILLTLRNNCRVKYQQLVTIDFMMYAIIGGVLIAVVVIAVAVKRRKK